MGSRRAVIYITNGLRSYPWYATPRRICVRHQSSYDVLSTEAARERLKAWMTTYEDLVGLREVKQAQAKVLQAEVDFLAVQSHRREKQHLCSGIRDRLKNLNAELEKIPRSDDRYLALLTEEHSIIKEETTLKADLAELEIKEREAFSILSQSLRDSHEKERAQSEKTKYWSLVGSCIGALIGIIGTSINNRRRMNELKKLVLDSHNNPQAWNELLKAVDVISNKLDDAREKSIEDPFANSNMCNNWSQMREISYHDLPEKENLLAAVVTGVVLCLSVQFLCKTLFAFGS